MKQPKLYYFMQNAHHYLISRIDKDNYWIFDICTTRYTGERWKTLKWALKWAKQYTNKVEEFETYSELFEYVLNMEKEFDVIDLYWDKNLVERESLHNKKVKDIQKKLFKGVDYN
jgi:hypothetical protein